MTLFEYFDGLLEYMEEEVIFFYELNSDIQTKLLRELILFEEFKNHTLYFSNGARMFETLMVLKKNEETIIRTRVDNDVTECFSLAKVSRRDEETIELTIHHGEKTKNMDDEMSDMLDEYFNEYFTQNDTLQCSFIEVSIG